MSTLGVINKFSKKKRINFERVAEEWLVIKKITLKESSYANYVYSINKYLMPEFQKLTLAELEKYNFRHFVEELSHDLEAKTVRDIIGKLKSILYYVEDEYRCDMRLNRIISPKLNSHKLVILSKRDKERLEKKCLEEKNLKSLGVIIGLYTGLRIGEVCSLKWKNINLDKKELNAEHTLQRIYDNDEKKTKIIIGTPKSKSSFINFF